VYTQALGEGTLSPKEAKQMFGRPFMGGLERKGTIAKGTLKAIRKLAKDILADTLSKSIYIDTVFIQNIN
jgi:hypothetical protein